MIKGHGGNPPRFAVPDFAPLGSDADVVAAANVIGTVLWDDLAFEHAFDMAGRDTYPPAASPQGRTGPALDEWRALGTDAVVVGTVQRVGAAIRVEVRLYEVRTGKVAFAQQVERAPDPGRPPSQARWLSHAVADELLRQQAGITGVARTRIVFDSTRNAQWVGGLVEQRNAKQIYICDYDGANPWRVTANGALSIAPNWSPDAGAVAYTSFAPGYPDIFVSHLSPPSPLERPTHGRGQNMLPAYSPDGSKIAFASNRDGNYEIYVMDANGFDVVRLTRSGAIDVAPAWSPDGSRIAFVSDRSGRPQIHVMNASDGQDERQLTQEKSCDRPAWAPAPFNEIAYTSRTRPGVFDIRIMDLGTGVVRDLTDGRGRNESASYAPNGRHLAFTSTRSGREEIFTIARDGSDIRQITRTGGNFMPQWSPR